jgi:glycosyltransferase involved in cell wall biosynthesis
MSLTVVSVSYALAEVGPDAVGGAEQVLTLLDRALHRLGHRSVVVAPAGSTVAGQHVASGAGPAAFGPAAREEANARQAALLRDTLAHVKADVIHLHSLDFSALLRACGETPTLATLHLPLDHYPPAALTPGRAPLLQFVSDTQRRSAPPALRDNPVVANGVELDAFRPRQRRLSFALALGRICPEKRFDRALRAAAGARVPLLLGGRVFPYLEHERHFAQELVPLLRRQAGARFLGPLALGRKRRLLAAARCLVVPSDVAETSSLVTMEALASGTPVVAWRSGALPDLIEQGRTGFLVESETEMAEALVAAGELDGLACRAVAERRFSADRMAREYLDLYRRLAGDRAERAR